MEVVKKEQEKPQPKAPRGPPPKARKVMLGLAAAVIVVASAAFIFNAGHESTDDAQVEGHIANIASRVGGQVLAVTVKDNELVEVGTVLVKIDTIELDARLRAANADLLAAQAGLRSAKAQLLVAEASADTKKTRRSGSNISQSRAALDQARADVSSAKSRLKLAQLDLERIQALRKDGVVAASELDAKRSAYDQAKAAVEQAEARVATARVGNEVTAPAQVQAAQAAVELAKARVEQAESAKQLATVNLSYAEIKAPHRGVVSRRTVEAGQIVAPGTPLLALVPLDKIWIVANFKEDQIETMVAGQPAHVKIDTFGGHEFKGHVESLAGATGSKFALLPPDNASGNFVKVVQRVPVLIRIDDKPDDDFILRPGMSATVRVDVNHKPASH